MDERRYMPRAHLDEGGDQFTNRAVLLSSGQEHCQRINFHVLVSPAACEQTLSPTRRVQGGGTAVGSESPLGARPGPCPQWTAGEQCGQPWPVPLLRTQIKALMAILPTVPQILAFPTVTSRRDEIREVRSSAEMRERVDYHPGLESQNNRVGWR